MPAYSACIGTVQGAGEVRASGGKPSFEWDAATVKRLKALDAAGELSREQIAKELGCSRATVQRKLRELTHP